MNKTQIRVAVKALERIHEEFSESMYMDEAMDGSGDCGDLILRHNVNHYYPRVKTILAKIETTSSELRTYLRAWVQCYPWDATEKYRENYYSRYESALDFLSFISDYSE